MEHWVYIYALDLKDWESYNCYETLKEAQSVMKTLRKQGKECKLEIKYDF